MREKVFHLIEIKCSEIVFKFTPSAKISAGFLKIQSFYRNLISFYKNFEIFGENFQRFSEKLKYLKL